MESVVEKFVEKQRSLLDLEYQAQLETQAEYLTKLSKQQLQKRGVALLGLRESSRSTGLAGKTLVEFIGGHENAFPPHQIKVGDVVKVERGSAAKAAEVEVSGIVSGVRAQSITVSFKSDFPEDWKDGLRLIKLANDVTFKRLRYALGKLQGLPKLHSHDRLLQIVFGGVSKVSLDSLTLDDRCFYGDRLNEYQKAAVVKALRLEDCALIHGPPGTGKTETLVEIIKQLARPLEKTARPKRVLVCAPSNLAVDNLVERLGMDKRLSIVRLGHPARMLDHVVQHSLDHRLISEGASQLVRDIRKDIDRLVAQLARAKGEGRREIYGQLKSLRQELKVREVKSLADMFHSTQVVLCTLNMAGSRQLDGQRFDVAVVDEASQALEMESWLPILLASKVIFAGDHQQLPPTVISAEAAEKGLADTMFGKLIKHRPELGSMLQIQYRMHEDIMKWASDAMYGGRLEAAEMVAKHRLGDIVPGIEIDEPIMLIDTAGNDMNEELVDEGDSQSKFNQGEAALAVAHARRLIESGLLPASIAVISPYNGQVDLIESIVGGDRLFDGMEIGTVDSFQGREKEAVIISFVRSNSDGEIGFLKDVRRTNVAVTRARRHVCLIGDSATLCRHPFYKDLVKYIEDHGFVDYPQ